MNINKTILCTAVVSVLGASSLSPTASAAILADGFYNVYINTTPTFTTSYGATGYAVGKDGAWNSSFTYGGVAPNNSSSFGLTDNGVLVTAGDGGLRGTSIAGDGYAGHWVISVLGSNVNFVSYSSDTTLGTTLGNIAQYGPVTGGGVIDQNTGALTLTPTGRLAASSIFASLYDLPFYVDDVDCATSGCVSNGNTAWSSLTTGSASTSQIGGPTVTINGAPVTALGDIDGDGLADYSAIVVSGGEFGTHWGGAAGAAFFEVKNIRLEYASPIPIPAAAWLFISGLLGFAGIVQRKRRSKKAISPLEI